MIIIIQKLWLSHRKLNTKVFSRILLRYFFQGIIILAPIGVTAYVLYWLFDKIDNILRPYVNIPGIGFAIILAFVILVGWISSHFLMGSVINFFDHLMDRTPGIKFIYTSTKDFFEAFAGEKKKFRKPVLGQCICRRCMDNRFFN